MVTLEFGIVGKNDGHGIIDRKTSERFMATYDETAQGGLKLGFDIAASVRHIFTSGIGCGGLIRVTSEEVRGALVPAVQVCAQPRTVYERLQEEGKRRAMNRVARTLRRIGG